MLTVLLCTITAIIIVVILHYEVLNYLSRRHFKRTWPTRSLLPVGVLVLIFTHIAEVWVFGLTYLLLFSLRGAGGIVGEFDYEILDCVYFSFVTYTTLGYGDLVPAGYVRFLAGTESVVGLVLIAWSASFTYLEMRRIVETRDSK
ncbi:MAG: ion channel [Gammaproteobacteria bacterium]